MFTIPLNGGVDCTLFEGCTDCLTHPDCKWCPGDADNLVGAACRSFSDMSDESCGDRGSACSTQLRLDHPTISSLTVLLACEDYDSCSHCTRHSPCQWCAEEDRCVDPTTSLLAACQPQSTCSCAQMRECDDCRVDLECAWCHDRRGCYNTTDFPSTCDVAETCSCTPSCQSIECGPYDGCGGSCGTCPSSRVCTAEGQCEKIPNAASNFIAGIAVGIVTMAVGVGTYWWFTRRKRDQSYTTIDTTVTSS